MLCLFIKYLLYILCIHMHMLYRSKLLEEYCCFLGNMYAHILMPWNECVFQVWWDTGWGKWVRVTWYLLTSTSPPFLLPFLLLSLHLQLLFPSLIHFTLFKAPLLTTTMDMRSCQWDCVAMSYINFYFLHIWKCFKCMKFLSATDTEINTECPVPSWWQISWFYSAPTALPC